MSIKTKYITVATCTLLSLAWAVAAAVPVLAATTDYGAQLNQYINRRVDGRISNFTYSNLKINGPTRGDGRGIDLDERDSNLYLTLYNESVRNTEDAVIQGMAIATGYKQSDLKEFLKNGNASFLSPNEDLATQQALAEALSTLYRQEREFYRDLAKLESKTIAVEIFTNGNERDAGFDLLSDLIKIEKILYSDFEVSQFGPEINLGKSFADRAGASRNKFTGSSGGSNSDSSGDSNSGGSSSGSSSSSGSGSSTGSSDEDEEIDYCQVDPSLYDALNDYEEEIQAAEDESSGGSGAGGSSGSAGVNGTSGASNSDGSGVFKNLLNENPARKFIDNSRKCDEGQVFCFYVDYRMATAESYFAGDRECVACEASDLRIMTDEIVGQSLTPQKVTGNFLEPNLCKRAAFSRKFNLQVNLLPRPVLPPQNITAPVEDIVPQEVARMSFRSSGFEESGRTNAAQGGNANLIQTGESQSIGTAYQEQVNYLYSLVPEITRDLETLSTLNNSVQVRFDNFANYIQSLETLGEEIRASLVAIKNKPQCE